MAKSPSRQREEERETESEESKQTARERGRAKRGAKDCVRQVFLAELPEALHIPARLIEAVFFCFFFVFSQ